MGKYMEKLSDLVLDIEDLFYQGMTVGEIAKYLNISKKLVRSYLKSMESFDEGCMERSLQDRIKE